MSNYIGKRLGNGKVIVQIGSKKLGHVKYHSPTGMEWGYSGSGPADLALSILCDVLNEHPITRDEICTTDAFRFHQEFKRDFIAGLGQNWQINKDVVRKWIEERLAS